MTRPDGSTVSIPAEPEVLWSGTGEPGSYHSGIDIATGESGTRFVAPAAGVVTLANERGLRLGCSPFTFLGEAQQAGAGTRKGLMGRVRSALGW